MHVRTVCFTFVLSILALCSLTLPAPAAAPRWEADTTLLTTVLATARSSGIAAVAPQAKAMEKALKAAPALFKKPNAIDGRLVVLTDGRAETTAVLLATRGADGETVALANPYPLIALLLGSYYVEVGKPRDALRVLDAGLKLSHLPRERLGQTVPDLVAEQGAALSALKRWKEALATYDAGLRLRADKRMLAVMHRGRGFALIELGRLEDAKAAYQKSLTLDPGNKIALGELQYIAGLSAGMAPTDPKLVMPNKN